MVSQISENTKAMVELGVTELKELANLYERLSLKTEFSLTKRLWWGTTSKQLSRIALESEKMMEAPL
jgi:hypothetical protein